MENNFGKLILNSGKILIGRVLIVITIRFFEKIHTLKGGY